MRGESWKSKTNETWAKYPISSIHNNERTANRRSTRSHTDHNTTAKQTHKYQRGERKPTTTTTTTTTTTILPIASLRFISRKMTHLSERIIPHLGGLGRDPSLCCSHSPQPALLGQETSLHGVPAPEDTPKRFAHSGNYDTPMKKKYARAWESDDQRVWESGSLGVWESASLRVWESGSLRNWESESLEVSWSTDLRHWEDGIGEHDSPRIKESEKLSLWESEKMKFMNLKSWWSENNHRGFFE